MKTPEKKNILISVPAPLLKKLDAAAKREARSRTAMVCVLLDQVLNPPKPVTPEKVLHERRSTNGKV